MDDLLIDLIADTIKEDLWGSGSRIVKKYTEENNGDQFDYESFDITGTGDSESSIVVTLGNKEYRIIVREELV